MDRAPCAYYHPFADKDLGMDLYILVYGHLVADVRQRMNDRVLAYDRVLTDEGVGADADISAESA